MHVFILLKKNKKKQQQQRCHKFPQFFSQLKTAESFKTYRESWKENEGFVG